MTIERLVKYCLQFLEQDTDTDVMNTDISQLLEDDTFKEYSTNMEHSIYMGLIRYATSRILPLVEKTLKVGTKKPAESDKVYAVRDNQEIDRENYQIIETFITYLTDTGLVNGKRIFHSVRSIYAVDLKGNIVTNIKYLLVSNKILIRDYDYRLTYIVVFNPTVLDLRYYNNDIYKIELTDMANGLSIPDEMAINIKYLVYSDMKIDESHTMANYCKNYFESYLGEMKNEEIDNNQVNVITTDWGDMYGN